MPKSTSAINPDTKVTSLVVKEEEKLNYKDLSCLVKSVLHQQKLNRQACLDYRFSLPKRVRSKNVEANQEGDYAIEEPLIPATDELSDDSSEEDAGMKFTLLSSTEEQKPTTLWQRSCSRIRAIFRKRHPENKVENKAGTLVSESTLIGGDFFTAASLTFESIKNAVPSLRPPQGSAMPVSTTGSIVAKIGSFFSIAGGLINIGVGIVCLQKGIQAWQKGQKKLACIYIIEGLCFITIGAVMFLSALAPWFAAFGGIAAFLAAHPWIVPVAFFVASFPTILQLVGQIGKWILKTDYICQFNKNKDELQTLLTGINAKNALHFGHLLDYNKTAGGIEAATHEIAQKLENIQQDVGLEAALKIYEFIAEALDCLAEGKEGKELSDAAQQRISDNREREIEHLLDQNIYLNNLRSDINEIQDALLKAKKQDLLAQEEIRIKEIIQSWEEKSIEKTFSDWRRSLVVRAIQQAIYAISFGVTMQALKLGNPALLIAIQNGGLALANCLPLYMEIFWPFRRNSLMLTDKISDEQIIEMTKQFEQSLDSLESSLSDLVDNADQAV